MNRNANQRFAAAMAPQDLGAMRVCPRCLATASVRERTVWAQTAEAARAQLAARLEMIRGSRWVKIGRTVGLGPDLSK